MNKVILFFILIAGVCGEMVAQNIQMGTLVVYVRTGDQTQDADSITALTHTIKVLNQSGKNVNGHDYNYAFRAAATVTEAVSLANELKPPGISKVFLIGHGSEDDQTGEFHMTLEDTTPNNTPFALIEDEFELFLACGVENKKWSNHEFGELAAKKNGHKYGVGTATSSGVTFQGVPDGWSPVTGGTWHTIEYEVQYTIFHPGGADVYLAVVTVRVWVPNPENPVIHQAFRRLMPPLLDSRFLRGIQRTDRQREACAFVG